LSDAIGIFAAAVRQACFALPSAVLTFALLVVIRLQACSALDRALVFWIFFVASRHFCLAAATPLAEPAVAEVVVDEVDDDVEDDVEVLELPHALTAAAATTSTARGRRAKVNHAAIIAQSVAELVDGPRRARWKSADKQDRRQISIPRSIIISMGRDPGSNICPDSRCGVKRSRRLVGMVMAAVAVALGQPRVDGRRDLRLGRCLAGGASVPEETFGQLDGAWGLVGA